MHVEYITTVLDNSFQAEIEKYYQKDNDDILQHILILQKLVLHQLHILNLQKTINK